MEINHKWAWTILCPYIQASLVLIKPYRYTIVKDLPFRDNYMNRIFMIKMKQVFHHFLFLRMDSFNMLTIIFFENNYVFILKTMFYMSFYHFNDDMSRTINVLIMNYFKDKLRVTAVGKLKLRHYSKSIHWLKHF